MAKGRRERELKGFTKEELVRLEELSFKNVVFFFREELNRLSKGEKASKVLSKGHRRHLKRSGVLRLRVGGNTGRRLVLSSRARKILKEMDGLLKIRVK